jgi:hypothetical protein
LTAIQDRLLSLNYPQLLSVTNNSPIEVEVSGRGTGKSTKKAWRYKEIVRTMPRSCNMIVTKTFQSLLTNTLSPLAQALESIGLYQEVHYVIGKKPPSGWDIAPHAPKTFENYLSFINGTGWRFMSQDREGRGRGPSVDSIDADEGLLLVRERFEIDALLTNRGNIHKFRNNPLHHGISITSSMPVSSPSAWILDFGNYYEENGKNYWQIWNKIVHLQDEYLTIENKVHRQQLLREWIELRKQIVFYKSTPKKKGERPILFTFFNVFDNIKNVGLQYVLDAKRMMSPLSFRIEMLNERINTIEDCFYPINEEIHLYSCYNNSYLESLDYNLSKVSSLDCRQDADVDLTRPIKVAIDYGHHINAMRIGQESRTGFDKLPSWQFRFLKSLYTRPPQGIASLVESCCEYYRFHKTKEVDLYYDHTHIGGEGWKIPFIDQTVDQFEKYGWRVNLIYIGRAPDHKSKYLLWQLLLNYPSDDMPKVMFNRENDREGIMSMQLAGVKRGKSDIEKDKSTERNKAIPREQATDLSDAGDMLVWGMYSKLLEPKMEFFGIVGG